MLGGTPDPRFAGKVVKLSAATIAALALAVPATAVASPISGYGHAKPNPISGYQIAR